MAAAKVLLRGDKYQRRVAPVRTLKRVGVVFPKWSRMSRFFCPTAVTLS
jgi:hypothetical protein